MNESSLFEPSFFDLGTCLGTNTIQLTINNVENDWKDGLLAVFSYSNEYTGTGASSSSLSSSSSFILIVETCFDCCYWGTLQGGDLKGKHEDLERILAMDRIRQLLLSGSSHAEEAGTTTTMSVSYKLEQQESPLLHLVIRETIPTPLVATKILFKGTLQPCKRNTLSQALGFAVNNLCQTIQQLNEQFSLAQTKSKEWEETAVSLQHHQKIRENELIENFLVLLNQRKAELRAVTEELNSLQKSSIGIPRENTVHTKRDAVVSDPKKLHDEDLHPGADYLNDSNLVDCLAAGLPVNYYNSYENAQPDATPSASSAIRRMATYESSIQHEGKRKNPISGAIEIWPGMDSDVIQKELISHDDDTDTHSKENNVQGNERMIEE